ncbi:hypothetical protein LWI28_014418 [Acer negundo]|uniref:Uncharacterized protein n=1 Tax=Acer negundo TaxID=4023 RepID=A0AAD5IDZ0_ACENE|nr:hypothetical protein LWI28_014418 [Acer negundo]
MPIEMPKGLLFSVDTFTPTSRSTVAEIKSFSFRFKPKAVNFHGKLCQINNGEIDFQGNSVELSSEEFHDDFDAESILNEEIEQGFQGFLRKPGISMTAPYSVARTLACAAVYDTVEPLECYVVWTVARERCLDSGLEDGGTFGGNCGVCCA